MGVPEDSKSPTFPSVGLHPHTWPKWGCDRNSVSFDDFGDVEANFLNQIKEEFKDQLDHYVELVDMA